ncbi:MAG: hypothetical protein H2045_07340 [Rhizobiales bacterium]|nr:hypothetical protein [Hyphomicrobiales bacterium]
MVQFQIFLTVYIIVVGFVSAGVLGSFYQLWRSQPIGFNIATHDWTGSIIDVAFCVFAGPFIIMRNTLRARQIEGRPFGWVVAASAIASLWSFCLGLLLVHTALVVTASISNQL